MTTTPNLPALPDEDGYILIYIAGRPVEVNGYRNSTMEAYALAAYQAGAAIDLAGHKFKGRDLIERVMRNMAGSNRYGRERWAIVKETFAVGSTVAHAMCHEFGLDPDDILRK